MRPPALCPHCRKSDGVLMLDSLRALTDVTLAGARIPHNPVDLDVPERTVVVMCIRPGCMRLIGVPVMKLQTATNCRAVGTENAGQQARTVRTSKPHGGTP